MFANLLVRNIVDHLQDQNQKISAKNVCLEDENLFINVKSQQLISHPYVSLFDQMAY